MRCAPSSIPSAPPSPPSNASARPAQVVVLIYLFQIAIIALGGILIGLVIGALSPMLAAQFLAQFLPVSTVPTLYPGALLLATFFGILTTLAFAILPLGHAREVPATALFREQGFEARHLPSWPYILLAALFMAALAGLAILTAYDRFIAVVFVGAIVFAFVVLRLVAALIAWLARRSPRVNSPALRLAIGNIHRPGALTPSVVLSLGLGLALLVTLTLIDGNLRRQLTGRMTEGAPNFFFVDIQSAELDALPRSRPGPGAARASSSKCRCCAAGSSPSTARTCTKMNVPAAGRWVLQRRSRHHLCRNPA